MNLVLIHGSYFGPWCWERVIPGLEKLGHNAIAVDLPISDRALGARAYADAVIAASDWSEPPVIVAHSMAGLVAPIVASDRPVRRLIFLASFLAKPGMSAQAQRAAEPIDGTTPPTTSEWTDLGGDLWAIGPNTARELFMHEAQREVADQAFARLRPQSYRVINEVTPLTTWPATQADYIVCRDDHATNPVWGRAAARARLAVEPVEMDGDHSPMFARPDELATLLDRLARA